MKKLEQVEQVEQVVAEVEEVEEVDENFLDIDIVDMQNGEVFIRFTDEYAHSYHKGDKEQILSDISEFAQDEECVNSWDGNEIEYFSQAFTSDDTELLSVRELKEELENW